MCFQIVVVLKKHAKLLSKINSEHQYYLKYIFSVETKISRKRFCQQDNYLDGLNKVPLDSGLLLRLGGFC